ncbi:hypothetical protein ASD11_10130 [Aeromicrobium sp. Root495]|uniref:MarR family winged helix-turn-helix transcriptional regulator n=1 Tax=Aeromicrobium sp. Root495 TaxID=1736550 RepID=UPI0006F530A9|nr:MarR family transcriptional regulator [Aeromicrobium sp. Root495]KQY59867.1 hypothetical protein ASD11_10130 [Aeromicrobium sp. Root495]
MTNANRADRGSAASDDLVRELRIFAGEIERYVLQMSHEHSMHRTDLAAIAFVMDREDTSPKDISEGLGLSPSATSAMLERLERAGHVRRERSEADRRGVRVEITQKALEVGGSMFAILARHLRAVLDDQDEAELARTAVLMEQINTATRAARAEATT